MGRKQKKLSSTVSFPVSVAKAVKAGHFKRKIKDVARRTIDDVAMTPFLRKITLFSSGGAFLEGYVLSLIGVALTQLTPLFNLDAFWSAAIGASVFLGILVGAILGGYLTDIIGRRKMFILDMVAIGVFSIMSMFSSTPLHLVIFRFLIGFFVGADYPISTAMITEFTSKRYRSIAMGVVCAAWYLGATIAAVVGFALFPLSDGWMWMLGSAAIPCLILLIGRHDIPESPLWLRAKGRVQEAREVMDKVYGEDVDFNDEEQQGRTSMRQLFHGGYFKRVVFVGLLILCQVVPMYAIYTFGPDIMTAFGLGEGRDSILGEAAVSLFFLIGTFPAMFWLNSMGRRPLLLISMFFMAVGLIILGIFPDAPIYVVILAFGIYAFFSGGPGILQWLYPNELFPTAIRASAVGVAISISRVGTIVSTYGTPLVIQEFGVGPAMLIAAALVAFGFVLSLFMAPETKGKTLTETSTIKLGRGSRAGRH